MRLERSDGYALITVLVFIFVITLVGMAFFSVASYETKGALYRQRSSESFYLADGAVERLRAKFLDDMTWRDGWNGAPAGRGTYDLTVQDMNDSLGYKNLVHVVSTGHVQQANRSIDVIADVKASALGLNILVMQNACVGGNLSITGGRVHVNGDAANAACNNNPGFDPDTSYTEGYVIKPPPIYTDAAHFPNATYYIVIGNGSNSAKILKGDPPVDVTGVVGDMSADNIVSFDSGSKTFTFAFNTPQKILKYFDNAVTGFTKDPGTIAVVVNFGEPPSWPNSRYQTVIFDGEAASVIHSTIINAKFIGPETAENRINWQMWDGWDDAAAVPSKRIEVKTVKFEPYYGIALIAENLYKPGTPGTTILGTPSYPALTYVTRDVTKANGQLNVCGSLIALRDFYSQGGPDFTYTDGFIANLPDYLQENWPAGTSGTLKIVRWREIASAQ